MKTVAKSKSVNLAKFRKPRSAIRQNNRIRRLRHEKNFFARHVRQCFLREFEGLPRIVFGGDDKFELERTFTPPFGENIRTPPRSLMTLRPCSSRILFVGR